MKFLCDSNYKQGTVSFSPTRAYRLDSCEVVLVNSTDREQGQDEYCVREGFCTRYRNLYAAVEASDFLQQFVADNGFVT
jgi:hypothetical protein